jgi:hypothetical protein
MPRLPFAHALVAIILVGCTDSSVVPTSPQPAGPLAAKAPPSSDINVTATIYDTDAVGNLLLTRSDDYNGAGFATYGGTVTSHITTAGGWQLLLNNQSTRTLFLVLAAQGIAGAPDGYYWSNVETYTRCFDGNGVRVSIVLMSAGTSNGNCTFGQDFSYGRTKYKLAMGPDYDSASPTGRATVTCNFASNGSCTAWTIEPNASTAATFTLTNGQVVSAPAANLYVFTKNGSLSFIGPYHNSYSVSIGSAP